MRGTETGVDEDNLRVVHGLQREYRQRRASGGARGRPGGPASGSGVVPRDVSETQRQNGARPIWCSRVPVDCLFFAAPRLQIIFLIFYFIARFFPRVPRPLRFCFIRYTVNGAARKLAHSEAADITVLILSARQIYRYTCPVRQTHGHS